ncbi:hypothetical protein NKG05_11195 [Oerskovia sp. M15]
MNHSTRSSHPAGARPPAPRLALDARTLRAVWSGRPPRPTGRAASTTSTARTPTAGCSTTRCPSSWRDRPSRRRTARADLLREPRRAGRRGAARPVHDGEAGAPVERVTDARQVAPLNGRASRPGLAPRVRAGSGALRRARGRGGAVVRFEADLLITERHVPGCECELLWAYAEDELGLDDAVHAPHRIHRIQRADAPDETWWRLLWA